MISNRILGMRVDATTFDEAVTRILKWAVEKQGRMVCAADVHMVVRHHDEPDFQKVMAQADLITPDGMSLVRMLRRHGFPTQERICGPDLTLALCREATARSLKVGFYGGKPDVLPRLILRLQDQYKGLEVAYAFSPPFRPLDSSEQKIQIEAICNSGVQLLFVGLGCPKQERWMAAQKDRVPAVMLGVGAAFDFHAGAIKRAPNWAQRIGLEWVYRLMSDPFRIAKRVAQFGTRYIVLVIIERCRNQR